MADPFRLAVLKRLTARTEAEMTVANGYAYDIAGSVFRGRLIFGEDDPLPMISVLEEPIPAEQLFSDADGQASTGQWRLMVQGFVDDDADNPTDPAYPLLADTKKVLSMLRNERNTTGGILGFGSKAPMVDKLEFGLGVCRPPDEISAKAYFWLSLTLDVVEDHDDPYTYQNL